MVAIVVATLMDVESRSSVTWVSCDDPDSDHRCTFTSLSGIPASCATLVMNSDMLSAGGAGIAPSSCSTAAPPKGVREAPSSHANSYT